VRYGGRLGILLEHMYRNGTRHDEEGGARTAVARVYCARSWAFEEGRAHPKAESLEAGWP
jgi:hypothetical protein